MNWEVIRGKWAHLRGEVKQKWAKLTDDDVGLIAGERDKLVGKIVERYGVMKDDAERQIDAWIEGHAKTTADKEKADEPDKTDQAQARR